MLTNVTALCILWYSLSLCFSLTGGATESKSSLNPLEHLFWKSARNSARQRLEYTNYTEWLPSAAAQTKVAHELQRFIAAHRASVAHHALIALPAAAAAVSSFAFILSRKTGGTFTALVATATGAAPILIVILVSLALASESNKRPTGCYVVSAIVTAVALHRELISDTQEECAKKTYAVPVNSITQQLETVAENLRIFGARRIRPNGRNGALTLERAMVNAAQYTRSLYEDLLIKGPEAHPELPMQLGKMLTHFVNGCYGSLIPEEFSPTEVPSQERLTERRGRRGLIVASGIFILATLSLTWAGLPPEIIAALLVALAPSSLFYLHVRAQATQEGASSNTPIDSAWAP
ncbi:hypothetical protein [Streptomyces sp. PHES57]|uniref:hypothetical protein n=1 Tax=Streptomyces TaxID=1883 RepID=UPI001CEDB7B1|nr:hypothetical protein [Streptomyces sp. PHES57]